MNNHASKAADYRAKAAHETQAGAVAVLDQVRAKHDRAAKVWIELAQHEDALEADRIRRLDIVTARAATALA